MAPKKKAADRTAMNAEETVRDQVQPRGSWRTALQRYVFARSPLKAQLYPPLEREVVFRIYEERDFEDCLAIHHQNQAGRFPQGNGPKFVEYLKREPKTFIIAECDSCDRTQKPQPPA